MQISDDRWDRINDLLVTVLELDPGDRAAYLDAECAGEPEVRAEVEALLRADAEGPDFLEGDVVSFAGPAYDEEDETVDEDPPQRHIGPYRLTDEIGRGGMSRVFRAERIDGAFEHEVAVKLLRIGLDGAEARRRFRLEQQVLARLDHPHITQLLDGGLTEDDVPYLVMEYVEGQPLTEYCDAHRCTVAERLRLLRTVAETLRDAHRDLVVHRDLKPSNILVTEDGTVKLLDFGIAKLLDANAAGVTVPATRTGVRLMTPAYAAPEQVEGQSVSTATDVYQLGVLAYELLVGRRPFDAGGRSPLDVEEAVRTETPTRPSVAVTEDPSSDANGHDTMAHVAERRDTSPEALAEALRGDLDAILLKALRKDPDRRYASVDALLTDLENHRDNRPVDARPPTSIYRVRKFIERYRGSVIVAGVGLLVVAGFVALLLWQRSVAIKERQQARIEAQTAEHVSDYLVNLFRSSNPYEQPDTLRASDLLRRGERRLDQLENRPAVQARMLDAMGRAHLGIGAYTEADSLLGRALTLQRRLDEAPDPDLARSLEHRAQVLEKRGEYPAAESLAQDALEMRRALRTGPHPNIAETLGHLALYEKRQGHYAPAESLYHEALSVYQRLPDAPPEDVATVKTNFGQLLTEQGDYAAAASLQRKAVDLRQRVLGTTHPETAAALNNLAQAVERQGRTAEAESLYRRVLAIERDVLGPTHPEVAITLNNLAVVVEKQGRLAEAESLKRASLKIRRETLGSDHPDVTAALNNLAVLLRKKGEYDDAAALFYRVLDRLARQYGEHHPYVAFTTGNLGDTRRDQGRLAQADSLYRAAHGMIVKAFGEGHPHEATALSDLAGLRAEQQRLETAETLYREALTVRRDTLGAAHPKVAQSLTKVANMQMKQGEAEAAEALYREALATSRDMPPASDWRTAWIRRQLGACLIEQRRYAAAETHLKGGLQVLVDQRGASDEHATEALRHLIDLYEAWGKPDSASTYRQRLATATSSE